MEVFSVEETRGESILPSLDMPTFNARISSGRRSSMRLPSLGSILESEQESQSIYSNDSAFEESSQFSSSRTNSALDTGDGSSLSLRTSTIILEEQEEREIERKARQEFKQEFRNIKAQTKEKQRALRKRFKSKITAARSKLLLARANAERETIEKLREEAERREAEIINQRKKRRNSQTMRNLTSDLYTPEEMAALRKVRAELDRARARRRSSIATSLVISRHKSMKSGPGLLPDYEVRRMEKDEEIHKIVEELKTLGLDAAAETLSASLENKVSSEEQLVENLKQERQQAKLKALVKKTTAVEKLRKIKIEEKEMLERERLKREAEELERLERERRIRVMNALKRKAFNIDLKNSLIHAKLTTQVSRAYTYSYFKTQQ